MIPTEMHPLMAATLDRVIVRNPEDTEAARTEVTQTAMWPMIVLATPKGWTGPKVVDGQQVEGTFRSHQVPLSEVRTNPDHLKQLEEWLRSYGPERAV